MANCEVSLPPVKCAFFLIQHTYLLFILENSFAAEMLNLSGVNQLKRVEVGKVWLKVQLINFYFDII